MEPDAERQPIDYGVPESGPARRWVRRRRRWLLGAAAVVAALLASSLIAFLSWYVPFTNRVQRAAEHAAKLRAAVAGDARFAYVEFTEFTGGGGTLLVTGPVPTPADVDALKRIVDDSKPPVRVTFLVGPPTNPNVRWPAGTTTRSSAQGDAPGTTHNSE